VEKVDGASFTIKTSDDKDVIVNAYDGSCSGLAEGANVEVRGVSHSGQIKFEDMTLFDGEYDPATYEQMLDYYHGMCSSMTLAA